RRPPCRAMLDCLDNVQVGHVLPGKVQRLQPRVGVLADADQDGLLLAGRRLGLILAMARGAAMTHTMMPRTRVDGRMVLPLTSERDVKRMDPKRSNVNDIR